MKQVCVEKRKEEKKKIVGVFHTPVGVGNFWIKLAQPPLRNAGMKFGLVECVQFVELMDQVRIDVLFAAAERLFASRCPAPAV